MDAYIVVRKNDQGERACRVIMRHVKLVGNENDYRPEGKVVGNLIVFYNQMYVPRMQKHFTTSISLKKSTEDYRMRHPFQSVDFSCAPTATSSVPTNDTLDSSIAGVEMSVSDVHLEASKENGAAKAPAIVPAAFAKPITSQLQKVDTSGIKEGKDSYAEASKYKDIYESGENELGKNAIVVATIHGGKEVKVMEKAAVDTVKPTENGTQKRTFSSMGGPKHHIN
jgi:hypothetical protein